MNLTDAPETYVVRLETSTVDQQEPWAEKMLDGEFGLSGFPQDRVEMWTAISCPYCLRQRQPHPASVLRLRSVRISWTPAQCGGLLRA